MIGRPLAEYFPGHLQAEPGEELLRVEGLSSPGRFQDVSFTLRAGEVLGLAGLVGAGRSEVAHALFGLDGGVSPDAARGRSGIAGAPRTPADAMRAGIGLVPEDRKRQGLVLAMTGVANVTLPTLGRAFAPDVHPPRAPSGRSPDPISTACASAPPAWTPSSRDCRAAISRRSCWRNGSPRAAAS